MVIWLYVTFCLFLQHMAIGELIITQDPNILNISKRSTANISCSWNSKENEQVRVHWRKHMSSPGDENGTVLCSVLKTEKKHSEVRNNKTTCNVGNNTALLTIENITEDDGRWYVCEIIIEIPMLKKAKGNGTQLNILDDHGVFNLDIRFLYLTILLIIPILISVYCLYCKKKKKERFLDHIYGNVKRSTTSSNKQLTCKIDTKMTKKMSP